MIRRFSFAFAALLLVWGCERKVKVIFLEPDAGKPNASALDQAGEEELRQRYEAKIKARENQPEPELDPNEPREKFEVVWRMGKDKLDSIYGERAEMIAMLRRVKIDDAAQAKMVSEWFEPLSEFGIGREPATMERAPKDLCELISKVRVPAETLIAAGEDELRRIDERIAEMEAKQDAGGTVYQKQWDKVDEERGQWSAPVKAGKQMLLVVKSLLDEAFVLADLGPRRSQIALRDCLAPIVANPLHLDLAQEQLEKVWARSKWYRDLR